jgi:hypothetical protein
VAEGTARFARRAAVVYAVGLLIVLLVPTPGVSVPGPRQLLEVERLRAGRLPVRDTLLNVAMFVPFGLLAGAALRVPLGRAAAVAVVLLGFGLSLGAEALQYGIDGRHSSAADVAANTLGTAAGVVLARWWPG